MKLISLGCNCEVTSLIRRVSATHSFPFDWLWSNIDFIINTFERDYFEFTECEKLRPVWVEGSPSVYIFNNNDDGSPDRICSAVSLHDADFQKEPEYISNIPKINEKYKRRFARLYEILNTDDVVIFIRKVLDKTQGAVKKDYDSNEKINYLSELLTKKFKARILIFLVDNEGFIDKDKYLRDNIVLFRSLDEILFFLQNSQRT